MFLSLRGRGERKLQLSVPQTTFKHRAIPAPPPSLFLEATNSLSSHGAYALERGRRSEVGNEQSVFANCEPCAIHKII